MDRPYAGAGRGFTPPQSVSGDSDRGRYVPPHARASGPTRSGRGGSPRSPARGEHTSPREISSQLSRCVTEEDVASAVQQNTLSAVRQWRDRKGGSLLHTVTDNTIKGQASARGVRECLRLGFDPNLQRSKDGCTPLHIACFRKGGEDAITLALRNDIAEMLLKSHARTDVVNRFVIPACAHLPDHKSITSAPKYL
jgi:hypothetical protein